MKWLDILLERAPFPCLCNKKVPDYGKSYSGTSYFVMCSRCGRKVSNSKRIWAIYDWDSKMMRELGQR